MGTMLNITRARKGRGRISVNQHALTLMMHTRLEIHNRTPMNFCQNAKFAIDFGFHLYKEEVRN